MTTATATDDEVSYRLTPLGRAMGCLYIMQAELGPLHPLQDRVREALDALDIHSRSLVAAPTGSAADGK